MISCLQGEQLCWLLQLQVLHPVPGLLAGVLFVHRRHSSAVFHQVLDGEWTLSLSVWGLAEVVCAWCCPLSSCAAPLSALSSLTLHLLTPLFLLYHILDHCSLILLFSITCTTHALVHTSSHFSSFVLSKLLPDCFLVCFPNSSPSPCRLFFSWCG